MASNRRHDLDAIRRIVRTGFGLLRTERAVLRTALKAPSPEESLRPSLIRR
jgi:hypothetical protein